jgi:hypothetical protein
MSKSNYRLFGSPITGTIYIGRVGKNPNIMLDKIEVPLSDFANAIVSHIKCKGKNNVARITADEKPVIELKSFPENF